MPRGGPDGGDGGRGGSVVLQAEAGMTTLGDFRRRRHIRAQAGGRGSGRRAHGRNAPDVVLRVPPGTVVRSHPDGARIGELLAPGDRLVVAAGGKGGRGNVHFATPTNRAPRHYEKGDPGEERWIELELKLIADIGLVGAPNAGKSTLLAALTAATPQIADYPFTTVNPNLGVIEFGDDRRAVIADVPGLIEGAHEGRGLGHAFLRHVERTRVIVGVVNGASDDPVAEWEAVAAELRLHDSKLMTRPRRIAVTKMDLEPANDAWPAVRDHLRAAGETPLAVSAHARIGLEELRTALADALDEAASARQETDDTDAIRVHRFDPTEAGWQVVAERGGLRVRGGQVETRAARTDFENTESRERFWRLLERLGIDSELRRMGAEAGTTVRIGATELEWGDED